MYRCSNSSPRYSVRTTMLSLVHSLKVSQVFKLQDKHNASFFSNMSWKGSPQSKRKSNKKAAIITYLVMYFFACLNGIGVFYSFIPLLFRCGITACLKHGCCKQAYNWQTTVFDNSSYYVYIIDQRDVSLLRPSGSGSKGFGLPET